MARPQTRISPDRPLSSYAKVRHFVGAALRGRAWLIAQSRLAGKQYLNLGCGPNSRPEFINLDYLWHPGIDVCWDVTRGLPLESKKLAGIFTEHCLEHLPVATLAGVFAECRRVLRSGGTLRVVVPDGELYLTRYADLVRGAAGAELPYAGDDKMNGIYSPIMSVNRIFREHGHLYIHDFAMLKALLERSGFVDVTKRAFMVGRDPALLVDTEARAVESLYLEASAP